MSQGRFILVGLKVLPKEFLCKSLKTIHSEIKKVINLWLMLTFSDGTSNGYGNSNKAATKAVTSSFFVKL